MGLDPWKLPREWLVFPWENSGQTQASKQAVLPSLGSFVDLKCSRSFHCLVGGGHLLNEQRSPVSACRVDVTWTRLVGQEGRG